MVPEAKVHDAPCAMSAQGLTPLVKASEVKHFDGFRVWIKFVVQAVWSWPFPFAAFSQTGQRQVILMLVFPAGWFIQDQSPDHHFEPFTPELRFLIADYVFFVIAHDVGSDIITTLFRG
jgi:hypothetical protein